MAETLRWSLVLVMLGASGWLPAQLLFGRLRSRGLLYARPIALLLVAQAVWLIAALTPIEYSTGLIVAALIALWSWSGWLAWRQRELLRAVLDARTRLLVGEAVFLGLFVLLLFVRTHAPAASSTEKPMDLMLLTAVHETEHFPPNDAWLAGSEVTYYHLGHTMVDVASRLAGTTPAVAFNIGVAAIGAMAAMAVLALAGDVLALSVVRRRASTWVAGSVAMIGFLWLAPFEGLAEIAAANGLGGESLWGRFGVDGLPVEASATHAVPNEWWWWWHASRVLPGTITEFPAFSIILGDLHAHLLALPLGIVALALAVTTFDGGTQLSWRGWLARPGALLLAGALFAGLAMTNSWDVVTYGSIWLLAAVVAFVAAGWPWGGALFGAVRYLALPVFVAVIIAGPLLSTLSSQSDGIDLVTESPSDPARFALFWLAPALPLLVAGTMLARRFEVRHAARGAFVAALPIGAWVGVAIGRGDGDALADRASGWFVLAGLALVVAVAGAWTAQAYGRGDRGHAAWLAMLLAAAAIILVTELFFVVDPLGAGRLNTVFKWWYAAWPLITVAGGVGVAMALDRATRLRPPPTMIGALGVVALLWVGSLLYAPAATVSRAREGQARGLDALAFLDRSDPGAAAAVRWTAANLDPQHEVLLEAVGRDYTQSNLVSSATGVPTLLAWPGHELQWRGADALSGISDVVAAIYGSASSAEAADLARDYGVTHVYLGREERAQFGADVADRFAGWPVAFEHEDVRIVEVPEAQVRVATDIEPMGRRP